MTRLSSEQRARVVDLLAKTDLPMTTIAQRFSVSHHVIWNINKQDNVRPKQTAQAGWYKWTCPQCGHEQMSRSGTVPGCPICHEEIACAR